MTKDKKMFSFRMDPDLYKKLRVLCLLEDKAVQDVLNKLISDYLTKRKNKG